MDEELPIISTPTDLPTEATETKNQINSEVLQNISVTISIEVGRAMIKIRDLMRRAESQCAGIDALTALPATVQPLGVRIAWIEHDPQPVLPDSQTEHGGSGE